MADGNKGVATVQLPGVDFAAMTKEIIAAKVTAALVGDDEVVGRIVTAALDRKVNKRGFTSDYSSENTLSFLEWVAADMVQKLTMDVIKAKFDELRPELEKKVEAALKRSAPKLANAIVNCMVKDATKNQYGFRVELDAKVQTPQRD